MQVKRLSYSDVKGYFLSDLNHTSIKTALRIIFRVVLILIILWMIYFIVVTISIPYQIEYREGAALVMTQFFLKGENPFSLRNQPLGMNNYGFMYSLFVTPFAAIFGNTLLVHRTVTFFFILLSSLLIFHTTSRINSDRFLALAGAALVGMGLAARAGLGAYPSAMGVFLCLAGILIPFNRSFDSWALVLSALLCVIAYYTKPYFVLAFGIVASYVFVFVSKRKGLFYSFLFISIFAVSFIIVRFIFKYYFIDTIVSNLSNTTNNTFGYMGRQLVEFDKEFFPLFILGLTLIYLNIGKLKSGKVSFSRFFDNFLFLDQPLVTPPLNYIVYFFVFSSLAFTLVLGQNPGSYMNYVYQILLPPFSLLLFQYIKPLTRFTFISSSLILLNIISFGQLRFNPVFLQQKDSSDWARLCQAMGSSKHILNNPLITSEMIRLGIPPVDSGQTEYYYFVEPYPDNIILGPNYQTLISGGGKYLNSINNSVIGTYYDKIFLTQGPGLSIFVPESMSRYYRQTDTITVAMPQVGQSFVVEIWKPVTK
jgi:hypothetical protein